MTKPTYHQHDGDSYTPLAVHRNASGCDFEISASSVAVIDPRPDSDDMQRLIGLFNEEGHGADPDVLAGILARYAAGPPPLTEEPTDLSARVLDAVGDEWARRSDGKWVALVAVSCVKRWGEVIDGYGPLTLKDES